MAAKDTKMSAMPNPKKTTFKVKLVPCDHATNLQNQFLD
jgi:hypothetical protein